MHLLQRQVPPPPRRNDLVAAVDRYPRGLPQRSLVATFEGLRLQPYQDVGGVWTVCYGHTGPDVVPGDVGYALAATVAQGDAVSGGGQAMELQRADIERRQSLWRMLLAAVLAALSLPRAWVIA